MCDSSTLPLPPPFLFLHPFPSSTLPPSPSPILTYHYTESAPRADRPCRACTEAQARHRGAIIRLSVHHGLAITTDWLPARGVRRDGPFGGLFGRGPGPPNRKNVLGARMTPRTSASDTLRMHCRVHAVACVGHLSRPRWRRPRWRRPRPLAGNAESHCGARIASR